MITGDKHDKHDQPPLNLDPLGNRLTGFQDLPGCVARRCGAHGLGLVLLQTRRTRRHRPELHLLPGS